MGDLATLFAPERVAVVGATDREGSVGRAITANLLADFEGTVVPVNPSKESVLGTPCVDDLSAAGDVDVAVIAVPPSVVLDVLRDAGAAGVENVVVITAGFGETGSEGAARERELQAVAAEYDLNIVGPNSLGVMSTAVGLNATFAPTNAAPGNMSFLSQSGAFVTAVLDWAADRSIGFKDVVSLGNKAVLDESDFVAAWGDDPDTDVILGYLEDVADGQRFLRIAREVSRDTPIVLVKAGRTEAGASAAASHTGALAGSEQAYAAAFEQAGVIRVDTVEELFDFAGILSGQPVPDDSGVGIVTNAGGPGVMATDAVGDSDLSLASFADATLDRLADELPEEANVYNPVDVIGDADVERFERGIDAVLADPNVDAAVVLSCPTATIDFGDLAEATARLQANHDKPVAVTLMGGESTRAPSQRLAEDGIPTYFDPSRAVDSLDALVDYAEIRELTDEEPRTFDVDRERAREVLADAVHRNTNRLGVEALPLLDAYGIPTPEGEIVSSPADAERVAARLLDDRAGGGTTSTADRVDGSDGRGDGVVMKLVSPDILHKSDIGGVEVGVSPADVADTYEDLVARARSYQPDATVLGVQVQERLDTSAGVETILGTNRDPQFGPLVMFGLGGIFVEVLEDTAFRVAPFGEREAREMISEIDAAPLLRGARGRDPVDEDAVVEAIQRLAQLVVDFPAILELDVNPLLATADGVSAVDCRLTIDQEQL
ncbi:MAG: acetate--CoA ligase family protein [Haloarculaceae archaeon]